MIAIVRSVLRRCLQFAEKEGFPLIVTICVGIITATAIWTDRQTAPVVSPTPPVSREISAAQLLQQSLDTAATPSPVPSDSPAVWVLPLQNFQIMRSFDMQTMQETDLPGLWAFHAGIDLAAVYGEPVRAIATGQIIDHGQDDLRGVWYLIRHEDVQALYAGMMAFGAFIPGDHIEAGDTLGFAGPGPLDEIGSGPHLHLETSRDGVYFDPLTLWETSIPAKNQPR